MEWWFFNEYFNRMSLFLVKLDKKNHFLNWILTTSVSATFQLCQHVPRDRLLGETKLPSITCQSLRHQSAPLLTPAKQTLKHNWKPTQLQTFGLKPSLASQKRKSPSHLVWNAVLGTYLITWFQHGSNAAWDAAKSSMC